MRMHLPIRLLALCVAVASCATASNTTGGTSSRNRMILTGDEIAAAQMTGATAYDLISSLRPEYLRSRGQSSLEGSPGTAVVYVDDMKFGDVESLRTLNGARINFIRYVNAAEATTRFGTGHVGGAILITTR